MSKKKENKRNKITEQQVHNLYAKIEKLKNISPNDLWNFYALLDQLRNRYTR